MYSDEKRHLNVRVLKMYAWSSLAPKIQKSIFSNRIFGFRSRRWIFGFPRIFFLDFFGFLERVFGFLVAQVENLKTLKEKDGFFKKKNLWKKIGFCKNQKNKEKDRFFQSWCQKSKKNQGKKCFFQKIRKIQVKVGFLQKSIFFLEFFF